MSDSADKPPSDGRVSPRRRVLLSGKIVYGGNEMTLDCAIIDISDTGARVRLQGAQLLVEPLYLVDLRHGIAYRARRAWRREDLVGLAFSERYDLRAPPPELPKLVRQLWVEATR
jgi:hypothetical protein